MAEDDPEPVNVHASWRMDVARSAARAYAPNERLAVFAVAGSVGSGLADRFSDLEVDCYWHEPPGDRDRRAPIELPGGQLEAFWEYDTDDEEWSEEYILGTLPVTISNFVVGTAERCLDAGPGRPLPRPAGHRHGGAVAGTGCAAGMVCARGPGLPG
jgi:hypothetical protein